jgi:ribosomal protein S2
VDYVIPGNDDALKSIKILLRAIKQTIIETKDASGISLKREEEEEKKSKKKPAALNKEVAEEKKETEETKEEK